WEAMHISKCHIPDCTALACQTSGWAIGLAQTSWLSARFVRAVLASAPSRQYILYPRPSPVDVFGLFRWRCCPHFRRSVCPVICHGFWRFHLPASLGSARVRRFLATMNALTPLGRLFGRFAMNTVCPQWVSLLS